MSTTKVSLSLPGKLARQVLRDYKGTTDLFPTTHIPKLREAAIRKYADIIEREVHAQS